MDGGAVTKLTFFVIFKRIDLLFIRWCNAESDSHSNKKLLMTNCGHIPLVCIIRTFNSDILISFQYYYNYISVLTARCEWVTYPSQIYRKTAAKFLLAANLNVVVNSDSNFDQIVF